MEKIKKKLITNRNYKKYVKIKGDDQCELNHKAIPVKVRKETIWVRTDIPSNAASLMKAIGMSIPPKIIAK